MPYALSQEKEKKTTKTKGMLCFSFSTLQSRMDQLGYLHCEFWIYCFPLWQLAEWCNLEILFDKPEIEI